MTTKATHLLLAIATVTVLLALPSGSAEAITAGAPATALSNNGPGTAGITYTFSGYTVDNGEMCTGVAITFPAGTDVSAATIVSPAGTIAVSGQRVTVVFTTRILKGNPVTVAIGNVTNPTLPGTYTVGDAAHPGTIEFHTANPNNNQQRAPQWHASASYQIGTPAISMTITTPDASQSVDFGSVDPGTTTAAKQVTVAVTANVNYRLSRAYGGSIAALGLSVIGNAEGDKTFGTDTFTDAYTLAPPWSTDPDVPLVATVTYTAVQL